MSCMSGTKSATRPGRVPDRLFARLRDLWGLPRTWAARRAFRRDLARMDARLWADIGLGAEEARTEVEKRFWEA